VAHPQVDLPSYNNHQHGSRLAILAKGETSDGTSCIGDEGAELAKSEFAAHVSLNGIQDFGVVGDGRLASIRAFRSVLFVRKPEKFEEGFVDVFGRLVPLIQNKHLFFCCYF